MENGAYTTTSVALDWVWVSYSTGRRFYIHDYNIAGFYIKGGSQYSTLEQSVIANCRSDSYASGIRTGDGTDAEYANPATQYESEYFVARNNIVRNTTNVGFFVTDVNWCWITNNLFADCGDAYALYQQYRAYIGVHTFGELLDRIAARPREQQHPAGHGRRHGHRPMAMTTVPSPTGPAAITPTTTRQRRPRGQPLRGWRASGPGDRIRRPVRQSQPDPVRNAHHLAGHGSTTTGPPPTPPCSSTRVRAPRAAPRARPS